MPKYNEAEIKNTIKELENLGPDPLMLKVHDMMEQMVKELNAPENLSELVLVRALSGLDDIANDLETKSYELGRLRTLLRAP